MNFDLYETNLFRILHIPIMLATFAFYSLYPVFGLGCKFNIQKQISSSFRLLLFFLGCILVRYILLFWCIKDMGSASNWRHMIQ